MNTDTTQTPRTDAARLLNPESISSDWVHFTLCGMIERELAEKTNEVARLRELLEKVIFELEKVPFQTPKLTAFTANRLADRYREQLNQLTK